MPTNSASALKKTNQELKAQINVLFGEIENLKSQLGVNANDESTATAAAPTTTSTAAAEQTLKDHQSPTNEHSDFQPVQTRAEAELKRLSARLAQVSAKVDEVGKAIDTIEEYSYQYHIKIVGVPELNSQQTAMGTSKLCANLSYPRCKLSSPKRRNLNLITTLNSVGPRIHAFIFVKTGIPAC